MSLSEFAKRSAGRLLQAALLLGFTAQAALSQTAQPITFHNNTMADFSATSGEPIVKVDNRDRIYATSPFGVSTTLSLLWRSDDGGRTYLPLGSPVARDAVTGPGGGDTDMDFDAKGRLYYVDLALACVTAAVSEDGGNTFPTNRTNYVTCVSEETIGAEVDDRQWVAAFGDGIGYATWRRFTGTSPLPFFMFKTKDGGLTWDGGRQLGAVSQSGPLKVDKVKRRVTVNGVEKDAILLYQIYFTGNQIRLFRITDFDDGTEPTVENLPIYTGTTGINYVFPVLSIDRAGNLYVVWSEGAATVYMATSTNRGQTWSARKRVSTFTGSNIMPWIVAGDPGRVDIVWYRSPLAGNPNDIRSVWTAHMAQSLNALDATPTFETVQVSQNVIHRGEICTDGTTCDAEGRDRSFLEYPSIDMDSKGAAVIVYNDNSNQAEGAYVMLAKQATGPSLINSVGHLGREPGTLALNTPAANSTVRTDVVTVEGTHTVPPKNFDRDEAGDAHFRSTDPSLPGADLRSVSVREEGESLVLTMQVADLTPAAVTAAGKSVLNGDGMLYLTQWDYNDTIYWLGAEVRGGSTTFYTGTIGMLRSATSKKFITYNPDLTKSQQVKGQFTAAAPGAITISVPKNLVGSPSAGAQFHTLTGYALSERGPLIPDGADLPSGPFPAPKTNSLTPDPTSLPVQLDASGAVTYTVGSGGPLPDGVVEVSLDDPNFQTPRAASFSSDLGANRWQLAFGQNELLPGSTHTVYARQRINGRDFSPVVSAQFTVSETVERTLNSLVSLEAGNARVSSGVASYDLKMKNSSADTIYTPLRLQVAQVSSASGGVTVMNADGGGAGPGAFWDYGKSVGADNLLTAGEASLARNLRFNNPNNEAFTVTFTVVGQLARGSAAAATTSGGSSSGGSGSTSGTGGTGTTSSAGGGLVGQLFQVTYNPLLNTTTVQLVGK